MKKRISVCSIIVFFVFIIFAFNINRQSSKLRAAYSQSPTNVEARIIKVKGDVKLTRFVKKTVRVGEKITLPAPHPVIPTEAFRQGDKLEVGAVSKATIECCDGICVLLTGAYSSMDLKKCESFIKYAPPTGYPTGKDSLLKKDLTPEQAARLIEAEKAIDEMNPNPVIADYLKANLYSSWRLKETTLFLDKVYQALTGEPSHDVNYLYLFRTTGDLCRRLGKDDRAKTLYELGVNKSELAQDDIERADSYTALSVLYGDRGDVAKAKQTKEQADRLYKEAGISDALILIKVVGQINNVIKIDPKSD